jgi:hypothetical protein
MREIGHSLFSFFRNIGAKAGLGSVGGGTGANSTTGSSTVQAEAGSSTAPEQGNNKGQAGSAVEDVANLAGSVPRHLSMKEVQLLRKSKVKRRE